MRQQTTIVLALLTLLASSCSNSRSVGDQDEERGPIVREDPTSQPETEPAPTAEPEPAPEPAPEPTPEPTLAALELGTVLNLHTFGDVYLSGQPAPEDFALLRDAGVRTVINLRPTAELADFDEAAHVESLGLTYVHLPFNSPDGMTDELIEEARLQLTFREGPVLVHCASANRVGALWIAHRTLDAGLTPEEALAEAKLIGLRSEALADRAEAYVAAQSEPPR